MGNEHGAPGLKILIEKSQMRLKEFFRDFGKQTACSREWTPELALRGERVKGFAVNHNIGMQSSIPDDVRVRFGNAHEAIVTSFGEPATDRHDGIDVAPRARCGQDRTGPVHVRSMSYSVILR